MRFPAPQRVLTDLHIKPIGTNQQYWTKQHFKVDSGAYGNLMPLCMFKSLYNCAPANSTVNSVVHLLDYNKTEIKQLSTCDVTVRFRSIVKHIHFYIVPDRLKPIIGVSDALALGLTSFHCPIYTDWQSNSDLTHVDSTHSTNNSVSPGDGTNLRSGTGTNICMATGTNISTDTLHATS